MPSKENPSFGGNEKYIEEHASAEEKKLFEESKILINSRSGYREGKLKLHFESRFENGDMVKAVEDERGVASVVIERNGQTILDFNDFLVPGYKMVTPSYCVSHPEEKIPKGWVGTYAVLRRYGIVLMGDMRDKKDLFTLLHEIGHVEQGAGLSSKPPIEQKEQDTRIQKVKDVYTRLSWHERDAWARAIALARRVKKESGVDLLESFDSFGELKRHMYASLLNHRSSRASFAKEGEAFSEEDMKIFKNLFDKGKFGKDKKEK